MKVIGYTCMRTYICTYSTYVQKYIDTLLQHVYVLVIVIFELDKALLPFSGSSSTLRPLLSRKLIKCMWK